MRILSLFRIILPISLVMFSCEDPNYPENIWDEDDQGRALTNDGLQQCHDACGWYHHTSYHTSHIMMYDA